MKFRILKEANELLKDIKYDLDVEQDFEGPELGEETGVAGLLLGQISKVAKNINDYNMMRANLEAYPEIDELVQDLADQENETLGKLQSALKSISPNAELIMNGAVEAEGDMDPGSPIDESLKEDLTNSSLQAMIDMYQEEYPVIISKVEDGWVIDGDETLYFSTDEELKTYLGYELGSMLDFDASF